MNKFKQSTKELYEQLRTLIELSGTVVKESSTISDDHKKIYLVDYQRNAQEAKAFAEHDNANFLKQLQKEVLTPWNETDDADARRFWELVADHKLPIEPQDLLGTILKRGRIADPAEYDLVQDSLVTWQQEGRIKGDQVTDLNRMIRQYEQKTSM